MKIQYFKTQICGDSYVAREDYMNIISISKIDFCNMSDNEGIFEGAYKNIEMSSGDFKELKEFAQEKTRDKGITLLKKIHENNKEAIENDPLFARKGDGLPDTCVPFKWAEYYNSRGPILE